MLEDITKIDNEIRDHEAKIKELIEEKRRLKSDLLSDCDPMKLLTSKEYRFDLAIAMTDSIKQAANLLKVSKRTLYRYLEEK